ncbi:hypothetical protein NC652_018290 [Populus alba x Populus x berolinensis]|nr:hypothetical protein NC652_018290 [Populus alba x Populus x berolinensis]
MKSFKAFHQQITCVSFNSMLSKRSKKKLLTRVLATSPRLRLAEGEYRTGLKVTQLEEGEYYETVIDINPPLIALSRLVAVDNFCCRNNSNYVGCAKGTFITGGRLLARPKCSSMAAKPSCPILTRRSA